MGSDERYDVVVIGGGPTGLSMAALMARRGWSVAAFEKHPARYGLPRAGHVDHEIVRILQGVGAHGPVLEDDPGLASYDWKTADGEILLSFPFGEPSISGFQSDYMMFQPVLEDALYASLEASPSVTVTLGAEVVDLEIDDDGVTLTIVHTTGEREQVCAAYVVAADGAGSSVRDQLLRIDRRDKGFNEEWLDVDVRLKRPLPSSVNGQWCDPARPIYIGPLGRRHHRFECALLPGEDAADMLEPDVVWDVLGTYGVGRDHVEPIRRIVYTFEARIAQRWRDGRVFLAGDAAHTMPPHMGQGLCSGIRDAANLAWKLDLVLRGAADDALLDTYERERSPHVETWIDLSIAVGRISQVIDPVVAAQRDERIRTSGLPPLPSPPTLRAGVLDVDPQGVPVAPAGTLFVQAEVEAREGSGLLHDVFGHGFLVVSVAGDPRAVLDDEASMLLETLGATVLWLGDGDGGFVDPTGRIARFFADAGVQAVVVRPDYYVAGGVDALEDLSRLVGDLAEVMRVAPSPRDDAQPIGGNSRP